ncbi:MAG TPA: hypothetical protein VEI29_03020, partial [Burkholderiaceae bacterium]|nr:hypothetical protein [Burkholderiaceae bacterium]
SDLEVLFFVHGPTLLVALFVLVTVSPVTRVRKASASAAAKDSKWAKHCNERGRNSYFYF